MDFSKPNHHWTAVPSFRIERRNVLHLIKPSYVITAAVHPKRYYNYETNQYDLDKMESIKPQTWDDLIEYIPRNFIPRHRFEEESSERIYYLPHLTEKFIPKDNDFDQECKKDEERKMITEKAEKEEKDRKLKIEKEILQLEQKMLQKQKEHELEMARIKEEGFRERQYQLLKERQQERREQIGYANVLKNKWIIK